MDCCVLRADYAPDIRRPQILRAVVTEDIEHTWARIRNRNLANGIMSEAYGLLPKLMGTNTQDHGLMSGVMCRDMHGGTCVLKSTFALSTKNHQGKWVIKCLWLLKPWCSGFCIQEDDGRPTVLGHIMDNGGCSAFLCLCKSGHKGEVSRLMRHCKAFHSFGSG